MDATEQNQNQGRDKAFEADILMSDKAIIVQHLGEYQVSEWEADEALRTMRDDLPNRALHPLKFRRAKSRIEEREKEFRYPTDSLRTMVRLALNDEIDMNFYMTGRRLIGSYSD